MDIRRDRGLRGRTRPYVEEPCLSSKVYRPGIRELGIENFREVEVLKNPGYLSGRKQVWVSAAVSDTDPCQLERFCINEETSSDSLLPVVSMMQATDAWE